MKRLFGLRLAIFFASIALVTGVAPASAQVSDDNWHTRLTLYGWLPTIGGTQSGPDEVPLIELEAKSVFDALNAAFFGSAEIRKGKFGLLFDIAYADLSSDGQLRRLRLPVEVRTKVTMGTVAATWRLHEDDRGWVDAVGGLRPYSVEVGGSLTLPIVGKIDRDQTSEWVDPIVGLRGGYQFTDRIGVTALGDIGGFGVGSQLQWELLGTVNYAFTDRFSGLLGYRYISVDYDSDTLNLDIDLYGPMVGLSYSF